MDAGEVDHLVGDLVVEDEDHVSHDDEGEHVADDDAVLFWEVEGGEREVEGENGESEENLVDEDDIADEVGSIYLE